ncbi:MAG: V-type ATP synthase subunit I [Clostridia bacterium]|nr:V-type ATP synthase subunit I [Clostridia bacterium]
MAKVKLMGFELISLLSESKKIVEYLQKTGSVQFENAEDEELIKYKTSGIVSQLEKKYAAVKRAYEILEEKCELKKSFIEKFTDCKEIEYNDYKLLTDKSEELFIKCAEILSYYDEAEKLRSETVRQQMLIDYYTPWVGLDIPMASKRTVTTNIFIGTFKNEYSKEELYELINENSETLDDVEIEIVSKDKMLTCALFMCHHSSSEELDRVLRELGFIIPDKIAAKLPTKAAEDCKKEIENLQKQIDEITAKIKEYGSYYSEIRFLSDYYTAQIDKYTAMENAASTQKAFYVKGYIPATVSEEIKFEIENNYKAQMELYEPDYENENVPVLLKNNSFAAGVEGVTNMYSPPSNKDVDPNPVMSFFYYALFGLMLSDAGYGLLMVIVAIFAKKKLKLKGNMKKTGDMILYCGIATVFWGAMFGGFFGDLIPTVCKTFLGTTEVPSLAIWMDPMTNSIELLLYCFLFGILHLFAGLLIRGYMLIRDKNYLGAICDTLPVMVFVVGFAIVGAGFFTTIPENIKSAGIKILSVGAVLIVLTAGRSSKNILGKLGGGLYGLYNAASGYLGDILSYSRLLALSLVTGVIANVINLLGAMMGNIVLFIIVFIFGHTVNIAINLIGTYVHTGRLQYVEFFSKFYEGSGRTFTPFKINSKFFTIKEENKYG